MWDLIERALERIEAGWLVTVMVIVAVLAAVDRWLYQRYAQRLTDSDNYIDSQRQRIDELRRRNDKLESRIERVESHADHCEDVLVKLAEKIEETSDIEIDEDIDLPDSVT